ncbi:putative F-box domain-containing protein [Colletotrichum tofieldiae]|nr:putative F-box domain-containing protein [Colletotrichum tofieldiae]
MASLASIAPTHAGPGIGILNGSGLATLPRELIVEVMKQLEVDPAAQLSKMSCVNRCFRDLSVPFLFRTMQLSTTENALFDHLNDVWGNRAILNAVWQVFNKRPPMIQSIYRADMS